MKPRRPAMVDRIIGYPWPACLTRTYGEDLSQVVRPVDRTRVRWRSINALRATPEVMH